MRKVGDSWIMSDADIAFVNKYFCSGCKHFIYCGKCRKWECYWNLPLIEEGNVIVCSRFEKG
jgi:hypothetical protein